MRGDMRGWWWSGARRPVCDAQNDIKELDEAALGVRAAAVLLELFASRAILINDTVWEASFGHVFRSSKEGADAVVKDVRVAMLIHSV